MPAVERPAGLVDSPPNPSRSRGPAGCGPPTSSRKLTPVGSARVTVTLFALVATSYQSAGSGDGPVLIPDGFDIRSEYLLDITRETGAGDSIQVQMYRAEIDSDEPGESFVLSVYLGEASSVLESIIEQSGVPVDSGVTEFAGDGQAGISPWVAAPLVVPGRPPSLLTITGRPGAALTDLRELAAQVRVNPSPRLDRLPTSTPTPVGP